jgi:rSAM/selenodomain-associated transferase 1
MRPDTTLIVFAKPPLPGLAKTRLIPALGPVGSARLAARMLDHALAQAASSGLGALRLYGTARHATLRDAAQRHGASRGLQRGTDLGARMAAALMRETRSAGAALLLGSDCPALDAAVLGRAAQALITHDCVFIPACDGGFVLVGCTRHAAARMMAVFGAQTWSAPEVMETTRQRLRASGLRWAELPAVHDIDLPRDLNHLPPGLQQPRPLPPSTPAPLSGECS